MIVPNTARGTRPVIGIVPSFDDGVMFDDDVQRIYLRRDYLETLCAVGALPLVPNAAMLTEEVMSLCDGIVLSGGLDIDPAQYAEDRLPVVVEVEPSSRFAWEEEIIRACEQSGKPILGVCYGMQRLNVYYGGSLLQDIPSEYAEAINHDRTQHIVTFHEDFLGMSTGATHTVASRHHQAIGRLANGLSVVASAPDGIIEAVRGAGHVFGIQWHPESDLTGAHIYRSFVEICSGV